MLKKHNRHLLIAFLICLSVSAKVYSQYPTVKERIINIPNFDKKTVHYGYFFGFNQYDFKFEYTDNYYKEFNHKDIAVISKTGFVVGLIGDMRINTYFNLRFEPGLYYSSRELDYPSFTEFTKDSDQKRELKSTYIHLPLLIKVSTKRINNIRTFVMAGISTDFNLSSNQKNRDDNASNVFRATSQNLNYELGFGFDFYLYYFKFSPSLRGVFSFQNELIPDIDPASPWTGRIKNMFSRGIAVIITFE